MNDTDKYKIRLIRRNGAYPPGGYPFQDARTGMKFDGMSDSFSGIVNQIIAHRQANPNIYSPSEGKWFNFDLVADELDRATCLRLGNSDKWCRGVNDVTVALPKAKVCPSCDVPLEEKLCPTCSGRRLVGYRCPKCGKDFPK